MYRVLAALPKLEAFVAQVHPELCFPGMHAAVWGVLQAGPHVDAALYIQHLNAVPYISKRAAVLCAAVQVCEACFRQGLMFVPAAVQHSMNPGTVPQVGATHGQQQQLQQCISAVDTLSSCSTVDSKYAFLITSAEWSGAACPLKNSSSAQTKRFILSSSAMFWGCHMSLYAGAAALAGAAAAG
jgi:hypothetical protein